MWTERPRALTDGLVLATAVGLALCLIVSIERETDPVPVTLSQCQEVVVMVHQGEEVLATCPPGTWLDIVGGTDVVCRCGPSRESQWFDRNPGSNTVPPPSHRIPQADPPQKDDKRGPGIWL